MNNTLLVRLFIFFSLIFSALTLQAQSCNSISLYSQADIDNFKSEHGCDTIDYLYIRIVSNDTVNLDSLDGIRVVRHIHFSANDYTPISSFNGLHNLMHLDSLLIIGFVLPNSFSDFPNIDINGIGIINCDVESILGLDGITNLRNLFIDNCPKLRDLASLSNLEQLGNIFIRGADSLRSVSFPSLTSAATIWFIDCEKLVTLTNCPELDTLKSLRVNIALADSFTLDIPLTEIKNIHIESSSQPTDARTIKFNFRNIEKIQSFYYGNYTSLNDETLIRFKTLPEQMNVVRVQSNNSQVYFEFESTPQLKYLDELQLSGKVRQGFIFENLELCNELQVHNTNLLDWPFTNLGWVDDLEVFNNKNLIECCLLFDQVKKNVIQNYEVRNNKAPCKTLAIMYQNCGGPVNKDNDYLPDEIDNCPDVDNPNQSDVDGDGVGDLCDNCPLIYNAGQSDSNNNGIGNACENGLYSTKLDVENGDAYIQSSAGLVLKGADGNCYRIVVGLGGQIHAQLTTCQ